MQKSWSWTKALKKAQAQQRVAMQPTCPEVDAQRVQVAQHGQRVHLALPGQPDLQTHTLLPKDHYDRRVSSYQRFRDKTAPCRSAVVKETQQDVLLLCRLC